MTTAAVIGHGPSPGGRGWGSLIDACDLVVRMWDCHWQAPADYGTRYDVGCFTISPREIDDFQKLCIRRPREWWAYDPRNVAKGPATPEPVTMIGRPAWANACRQAGGRSLGVRLELTRGTAAAMAALERKPAALHMIGFDTIASGSIAAQEYGPEASASNARRKVTPQPKIDREAGKTASHDYPAERRLIEAAAAAAGARLVWGF